MAENPSNLVAIAAMAAVTLACRCGGYFVFSRIRPTPFIRNALVHLPGCIFVAYVVPRLLTGSPATSQGRLSALPRHSGTSSAKKAASAPKKIG